MFPLNSSQSKSVRVLPIINFHPCNTLHLISFDVTLNFIILLTLQLWHAVHILWTKWFLNILYQIFPSLFSYDIMFTSLEWTRGQSGLDQFILPKVQRTFFTNLKNSRRFVFWQGFYLMLHLCCQTCEVGFLTCFFI